MNHAVVFVCFVLGMLIFEKISIFDISIFLKISISRADISGKNIPKYRDHDILNISIHDYTRV